MLSASSGTSLTAALLHVYTMRPQVSLEVASQFAGKRTTASILILIYAITQLEVTLGQSQLQITVAGMRESLGFGVYSRGGKVRRHAVLPTPPSRLIWRHHYLRQSLVITGYCEYLGRVVAHRTIATDHNNIRPKGSKSEGLAQARSIQPSLQLRLPMSEVIMIYLCTLKDPAAS